MSRAITNNTGFDLYRYTSADATATPRGNGYLFANNTTININIETMICVDVDSDLLSVQLTNGTILTVNTRITGSLSVYNSSTGDYDDISVHPLSNFMGSTSSDTTLTAHEVKSTVKQWSIIKRLTNCTLTPTDEKIDDNTQVTFKVTANTGYHFTQAPTLNGVDMTKVDADTYTKQVNVTSDITIIATASKTSATNTINYHLQNATGTPTTAIEDQPTTVTITANDGYNLVTVTGTYDVESGDSETINFTIADDKKTATATFTIPADSLSGYHNIQISCTSTQAPITKILNDLIAIYIPTDKELGEISTKQFISAEGQVYKLSEFITSYKKLYIPKELLNIVGKNYVVLGYYDTNVECDVVDDFMINLTLYFPNILHIHNNSYDFTDNKYRLYLPFIGITDLDADEVLDADEGSDAQLTIFYKFNLITAQVFVSVSNTKGFIIYEGSGVCGFDVPYKTSDMLWSLYNQNASITGYTPSKSVPMLQVMYHNELSNSNNIYATPQWTLLSDITGYTQFSDIDLSSLTDATFTEKDELETILEKGVFL